jgi:hypothetical protein
MFDWAKVGNVWRMRLERHPNACMKQVGSSSQATEREKKTGREEERRS